VGVTTLDDLEPEEQTGTDGVAPGPLDQALLGGEPQRVGRFEYHYNTDTWIWSDAVARMYGYEPGDVQPTTQLILSHKHPDDLERVKGLLKESSAPFSSRHRIRTRSGDERTVVVVGQFVTDEQNEVIATGGFHIDVTNAVRDDIQRSISDELEVIVAHRAVIEQAKGMLVALYDVGADSAFDVLRWRSQERQSARHRPRIGSAAAFVAQCAQRGSLGSGPLLADPDPPRVNLRAWQVIC
jgi:PAS domain S-box-containing protein